MTFVIHVSSVKGHTFNTSQIRTVNRKTNLTALGWGIKRAPFLFKESRDGIPLLFDMFISLSSGHL